MNISFFAKNKNIFDVFPVKKNPKNAFNSSNNRDSPSFFSNLLSVRWFRIAICFVLFLFFLLLWQYVGQKFTILIFTLLPLFIGYGFSYLLEPVNRFFCRFFSEKVSRFIVFFLFLFFTLSLVLGLFFIFFIQLDDLYQKFLFKTEANDFNKFLDNIVKKKDSQQVKNFVFVRDPNIDQFKLTFEITPTTSDVGNSFVTKNSQTGLQQILGTPEKPIIFDKNEVAGIFILFLKISSSVPILKGICFSFMNWIYTNMTNYGYLESLFNSLESILLFLYLFFFTIVIAVFSLGKGSGFYNKIWWFLTKNNDEKKMDQLKIELKKNLSAWGKGLLMVQLYIFICTGVILFIAGIIFSSWSSYDESAIVLTLFMALCNLVPYIGPTIGFIPIISIGLIDVISHGMNMFVSWIPLIIAVVGCFLVQVGESALVSPLVYSYKIKLNPILIIVGLAVFGVLFGVLWMPIAIPAILILKIIYQVVYQKDYEYTKHQR